jgi:hypothetical protein
MATRVISRLQTRRVESQCRTRWRRSLVRCSRRFSLGGDGHGWPRAGIAATGGRRVDSVRRGRTERRDPGGHQSLERPPEQSVGWDRQSGHLQNSRRHRRSLPKHGRFVERPGQRILRGSRGQLVGRDVEGPRYVSRPSRDQLFYKDSARTPSILCSRHGTGRSGLAIRAIWRLLARMACCLEPGGPCQDIK